MFALKKLGVFLGWAGVGTAVGWGVDDVVVDHFKEFLGYSVLEDHDYLMIKEEVPLEERRAKFAKLLNEKGASGRLVEMVSDFNNAAFDYKVRQDLDQISVNRQMQILEEVFRKYYPELFDSESGQAFIRSLNLKLNCEDFYKVPAFLKPIRK